MAGSRVECYTVAEAARRLDRDAKTVRAWMARGRLSVVSPDDPRNPVGEPLVLAEEVDAAADGNRILLRPPPSSPHPEVDGLEGAEWLRRENRMLTSTVEMLQRELAQARADLARERAQRRRLLEAMMADLDETSTAEAAR